MNTRLSGPARARAAALGILGFVLLAGACDTPLPTSAEVEKMDVAALEARTAAVRPAGENQDVTYYVDDQQVTAEEARALTPDQIAQMDVSRNETAGGDVVRIYTLDASKRRQATGGTFDVRLNPERADGSRAAGGTFEVRLAPQPAGGSVVAASQDPMVVIDGVVADKSALSRLTPDEIAQVDVIKGEAARALYSDPRAANGVIRITTKAAAGTQ